MARCGSSGRFDESKRASRTATTRSNHRFRRWPRMDSDVARSGRSGKIARRSACSRALRMLEAQRRQGAKFGAKYGMPVSWFEWRDDLRVVRACAPNVKRVECGNQENWNFGFRKYTGFLTAEVRLTRRTWVSALARAPQIASRVGRNLRMSRALVLETEFEPAPRGRVALPDGVGRSHVGQRACARSDISKLGLTQSHRPSVA